MVWDTSCVQGAILGPFQYREPPAAIMDLSVHARDAHASKGLDQLAPSDNVMGQRGVFQSQGYQGQPVPENGAWRRHGLDDTLLTQADWHLEP